MHFRFWGAVALPKCPYSAWLWQSPTIPQLAAPPCFWWVVEGCRGIGGLIHQDCPVRGCGVLLETGTLLQPFCNSSATLLQLFCNPSATLLQPFCNPSATLLQPFCNHSATSGVNHKFGISWWIRAGGFYASVATLAGYRRSSRILRNLGNLAANWAKLRVEARSASVKPGSALASLLA